MYYMPSSGAVLANHSDIRSALPNVLFFSDMSDDNLSANGVFVLGADECPVDRTQIFTAGAPVLRDGAWWRPWEARAATPAEIQRAQLEGIEAIIKAAVARLNAFASTRIYGDEQTSPIVAACSYAASTHERYGPEGRYCVAARDQTWDVLNQMRDDVLAGLRQLPSDFEEFEPELPVLAWPT